MFEKVTSGVSSPVVGESAFQKEKLWRQGYYKTYVLDFSSGLLRVRCDIRLNIPCFVDDGGKSLASWFRRLMSSQAKGWNSWIYLELF